MSVDQCLAGLIGSWKGTNNLYLSWEAEPIRQSPSEAIVKMKVAGQFVEIAYTWSFEGKPQEGSIVIGCDNKSNAVQAVWTDSWHMSHKFMLCDGYIENRSRINVFGKYSVADNEDWGWRTEVIPEADTFRYRMYNISPDGAEELAVDTEFTRVK